MVFRMVLLPDFITQVHQFSQWQILIEIYSLIHTEELAGKGFYIELIFNFSTFVENDGPKLPKNHASYHFAYRQIPAGR